MDQVLRVRVLGGAELTLGGRLLVERMPAKAAAMVFYLAVTGGAHSRSELAGLLWSDLPEETARANLRLVLTKLRRVLPEHVQVTRHGVGLTGEPTVWVDAAEVERSAADDIRPQALLATVRLCDGDLLDGFAVPGAQLFDDWVSARRAGDRAEMLALMDRALSYARDARDAATGVEVARRMVGMEPLHEEAHRALMWFLALGDQRSAAVAQYETCRYLLREELGVEPSAATVALREEITRGGGFTALARTDEQAAGLDLPRPLTTLVGREQELARLRELLRDPACQLITLVGPGGIGKTRLATELAAVGPAEHRDGAVFVSFVGTEAARPGEAAALIVAAIARALGVSLAVPRDPLDLLVDHFSGRRLLLVLDNLEHLWDGAGAIAELLRRAQGLTVVVTSRRPLGIGVEWLVEVPGLPYPPPGADADAGRYAAVQLFNDRARLLRPGYRTDAGDEGAARVCRLVAGVPLAIELAARWVRSASPSAIADRLAQGVDLLETTSPDVEHRHRSLRSVIDWSYGLLSDEERAALCRLSVLRHSFDLEAAAMVAGADLPLLTGLVDQSLIAVGEDGRYAMHELLRQYAAETLANDPAAQAMARRRHADHFSAMLTAQTYQDAAVRDASWPGAEAENLRAATEWIVVEAAPAVVDSHLVTVWAHHRRAGSFREAQAFLEAALERDDATTPQRARWHRMVGEVHEQLGEAEQARHHLERALQLLGHRTPASLSGWLKVLVVEATRRSLRRLRLGGSVEGREDLRSEAHERASAGFSISEVYWVLEEPLLMLPTSLRTLNDAQRTTDPDLVVRALAGLGMIVGTVGLHRLARRQLSASRSGAEGSRDPLTACWVAILGGLYWTGVGDWAAVEASATRAMELQREDPMRRLADQVILIAGVARYLTARYPEAASAAAEGMTSGRDRRDPVVHFWGLVILIETALRAGPDNPALGGWSAEATRLLPRVALVDAARLHASAARIHLAAGRPGEAWDAIRTVHRLIGLRPSFEQYALEAHAAVPEVCLALLELHRAGLGDAGAAVGPGPVELRSTAAAAQHRLDRYARTVPIARPRALICAGWAAWVDDRPRAARRAWVRAVHEAQRLAMPYELAWAHEQLGRHLAPGRQSHLGLDRAGHLEQASAGFRSAGCTVDAARVDALALGG
jgi:predicted ATPase/DNA-binding SARP family transcriptional activator